MSDRKTAIGRSQLKPIRQDDLDATNEVVDNYIPSYDAATGKFTWVENAGGASNHNDLSNIQGGQAAEYYHLTSADYTELTQWIDNVTLGSDEKLTVPSLVATTADINAGTFDGVVGGTTPAAGVFTTLIMNTGLAANLKMFADAAGTGTEWAVGMKIGTFSRNTATATGTQAVTGVGFKPSRIIFLGYVVGTTQGLIGFSDGTTDYCITFDSNSTWTRDLAKALVVYQSAGINYQGEVTAIGSDGFTVSWAKYGAKTGTLQVFYMAFR